jgi:hypothetical protein
MSIDNGGRDMSMIKGWMTIFTVIFFVLSTSGCKGDRQIMDKGNSESIRQLKKEDWLKLSQKKIYFGHQSVGFNIIDGVKELIKVDSAHASLKIVETRNAADFQHPIFGHSKIGENTKPLLKVDDFVVAMEGGIGQGADIACFKLCYVDITKTTDVRSVFDYYKKRMQYLEEKYPRTSFIHVTVPLTTIQSGLRVQIKKLLGRYQDDSEDNVKRNEYNDLMRQQYEGKKPLFDLARIEATHPNKTYEQFKWNDTTYQSLVSQYTYDGGHLNDSGKKIIAFSFLELLAKTGKQ